MGEFNIVGSVSVIVNWAIANGSMKGTVVAPLKLRRLSRIGELVGMRVLFMQVGEGRRLEIAKRGILVPGLVKGG